MKKKIKIIAGIVLILLIIALVIFCILFLGKKDDRLSREEAAIAGLIPGKSDTDIQDILNQRVAEGMVDVSFNATPLFEKNGEKGNINIQNIPGNHYSFLVTLTLDETGETLYKSNLIEPGYYIEYIKLKKRLKKGSYNATLLFEIYNISENQDELIGQVNGKVTMNVIEGNAY